MTNFTAAFAKKFYSNPIEWAKRWRELDLSLLNYSFFSKRGEQRYKNNLLRVKEVAREILTQIHD